MEADDGSEKAATEIDPGRDSEPPPESTSPVPTSSDEPAHAPPSETETETEPETRTETETTAETGSAVLDATATAETARPGKPAKPPKAPAPKKWRRDPVLAMAFRKGVPVEGRVEQVIKGGYEVRIGKARGFCPHSQIELHHVGTPEQFLGSALTFKVLQLRRGGEEAILSRRALLEERLADERKAVRATLLEGHVTQGHVVRVTEFGGFVDLGAGVTGLVHVSEIAHGRVPRAADVLAPGQTVHVKILKLDDASGKISLSMRQALRDPWESAAERFPQGSVHPGTIRRIVDFGAFVDLPGDIEALAPADSFAPGPGGWKDGLEAGQQGSWRVFSVDIARHQIAVHPAGDGVIADAAPPEPGALIKGRVQKVERFGVFIWLRPGMVGMMPGVLTGTRKGTDLTRVFPVGHEIDVEVVEVDPDGKRIRIAVPGAAKKQDAPPPPPPKPEKSKRAAEQAPAAAPAQSFGTSLGDALRAAMKKGGEGDGEV